MVRERAAKTALSIAILKKTGKRHPELENMRENVAETVADGRKRMHFLMLQLFSSRYGILLEDFRTSGIVEGVQPVLVVAFQHMTEDGQLSELSELSDLAELSELSELSDLAELTPPRKPG